MSIARRLMVDRLALLGKVVFPGPLGFGDAGVPLVLVVLAFELTEFIAQAGGFVAILLRLEAELGRRDAVNRIENLCDGIFLALARMGQFVGLVFFAPGPGPQSRKAGHATRDAAQPAASYRP